jgi:signal transduction histidine kinase
MQDAASQDELRITAARLARLSVLQELTAAAVALANPAASVDRFLQQVAERMGCVAVLWIARDASRVITLQAAAGVSRQARMLPIAPTESDLANAVLPYPELDAPDVTCWRLPLPGIDRRDHCLWMCVPREVASSTHLERLAQRIAETLESALTHRALYTDLEQSYFELERTQRALVIRERLAALGEMAAAVAHEVRNPLGAIFNSLATLKKVISEDPESTATLLTIVEEEAGRLNTIISDLLDFAKPGGLAPEDMAIDKVLEATVEAAEAGHVIPGDVVLEVQVEEGLPTLALDGRLMVRALLNVLSNALQESPRPGRVVMSAKMRTPAHANELVIAVADEGRGIEEEVRDRIFEPFFTTKSAGTGLGLAIVKRIVEAHGGRIDVESMPAAGTTFRLVLPIVKVSRQAG